MMRQNWHNLPLKRGSKLTGHRLVFYNLSPMLLIIRINKMFTLCVATVLLVSQVWFLLIWKELKCDLG